jgi:hypothetical protein
VDALSKREIIDYYTQEMKVQSITKRTPVTAETENIQYREIDGAEMPKLEQELSRAENLLAKGAYENDKYVTPQLYGYMKYALDDKVLRRNKIVFKGASKEFYVLDVEYDAALKNEGSLKEDAQYLGVHGVFIKDSLGRDHVDAAYVGILNNALAAEQEKNNIKAGTGAISFKDLQDKQIDKGVLKLSPQGGAQNSSQSQSQPQSADEAAQNENEAPAVETARDLNINVVNNVLGSMLKTTAYVPDLSLIFVPSATQGNLSGLGIYAEAAGSLKNFGVERGKLSGKAVLRYVFRSEIGNTQSVHLDNVYVKSLEIEGLPDFDAGEKEAAFLSAASSGKKTLSKSVFLQFAETAISAVLDRADRLKMNNDTSGFMNGRVYGNIRVGILYGYAQNSVINHRTVTDVRKSGDDYTGFLRRDGNYWLIAAESTIKEQCKYNLEGETTSKETHLISLKQNGDEFLIDDTLLIKKELLKESDLNAESNLQKRYTYLSLSGDIPAERRAEIQEFYKGFTELAGDRKWQAVYDSLNSDTEMLGKTRRDYIYSTIRGNVLREGEEQPAEYCGAITEWLGGAKEQAEFMTEELVNYPRQGKGLLIQNYYLVSKFGGVWVIDEVRGIETKIINKAETSEKAAEIKSYNH